MKGKHLQTQGAYIQEETANNLEDKRLLEDGRMEGEKAGEDRRGGRYTALHTASRGSLLGGDPEQDPSQGAKGRREPSGTWPQRLQAGRM